MRRFVALVGVLALAACGSPAPDRPVADLQEQVAPAAAAKDCADGQPPVASLAPGPESGSGIARIKRAGKLVAGTSGDVLLWGARDPGSGRLEGYDIELIELIARELGVKAEFRVINYGQRIPSLQNETVDIVAHTMTINCERWKSIDFTTEYYRAGQKVLVREDLFEQGVRTVEALEGKRVCVAEGSTNIEQIEPYDVQAVPVADLGSCLVKFQEGEVDAITGDDTVLAGFAAQDRYARVSGPAFSEEPYGIGVRPGEHDVTRFLNTLLERWRADGTLARLYDRWMADAVEGAAPPVPPAVYGREVSRLGRG